MDLQQLYSTYAKDVHRFAMYLSCNAALADDITSETFLRAWNSTTPIREATVKAYLFMIARNVYLQEVRRTARHDELDADFPASTVAPDKRIEHQSTLTAVLRALQHVPAADRVALMMRTHDNTPYEEIAQVLELSVSAVKVKVHRARLKLAALL